MGQHPVSHFPLDLLPTFQENLFPTLKHARSFAIIPISAPALAWAWHVTYWGALLPSLRPPLSNYRNVKVTPRKSPQKNYPSLDSEGTEGRTDDGNGRKTTAHFFWVEFGACRGRLEDGGGDDATALKIPPPAGVMCDKEVCLAPPERLPTKAAFSFL